MISEDEYLERIVAGIHAVTTAGADVNWSEVINGRQFDVVVRFRLGSLRYLVLVEVKNRTRKIEVSDMDAFVLKARDQNANKAVFVTAAGFQSGAIEVARRHAVDLFTVKFDETQLEFSSGATITVSSSGGPVPQSPPHISAGQPILAANIEKVELVYTDGRQFSFPTERTQMTYYVAKTVLSDGRGIESIVPLSFDEIELGKRICSDVQFDPVVQIEPPDDYFFPKGHIRTMRFTAIGSEAIPLQGNTIVDPTAFKFPVIYTNVITNEVNKFSLDQLPLGGDDVSAGNYYFGFHPLAYYYCASVEGTKVTWYLIESFQNGQLITATYTQQVKYSPYYILVRKKVILERLRKRLDDFLRRASKK